MGSFTRRTRHDRGIIDERSQPLRNAFGCANAPPEVIRAAYRALSQKWHPDKNASPRATEAMRELNVAYAVLSDLEKRSQYDQLLEANELRWTSADHRAQPNKQPPDPKPAPMPKKRKGAGFDLDEAKFNAAMRQATKRSPKNDHPYVRLFPPRFSADLEARSGFPYGLREIVERLAARRLKPALIHPSAASRPPTLRHGNRKI